MCAPIGGLSLLPGPPKPPTPPDYVGAAAQQGQDNLAAARAQNAAGRVNQYTPYGNQVFTQPNPGNPDQWSSTITLAPEQQQLLNSQNAMSQNMANVGNQNIARVGQAESTPFSLGGMPSLSSGPGVNDFGAMRDKAYGDLMTRQNQGFDQQDQALQARLANQGITAGSDAYNRAYQPLNQARVDASTQSDLAANALQNQYFNQGQQAAGFGNQVRGQGIQEQNFLRSQPLNELNALRTGAQVTNPSFQTFNGAPVQAAPSLLGQQLQGNAAQNTYGQQVGSYNNMMQGLFGLGGAALGMGGFSDRRLKRNIVRTGTSPNGYPWYKFEYIWGVPSEGVMSDEVPEELVIKHSSGFDMVDYGRV